MKISVNTKRSILIKRNLRSTMAGTADTAILHRKDDIVGIKNYSLESWDESNDKKGKKNGVQCRRLVIFNIIDFRRYYLISRSF